MHVAIFSNYGSAGIALRLHREGHDVLLCCDPGDAKDYTLGRYKLVGEGLVPLTHTWGYLLSWAEEKNRRGLTVMIFEGSGTGDKADQARKKGLRVIGGGAFCDKLEKDRAFGFKVAEAAGAMLPPFEEFRTVTDAIAFAHTLGDTATYWKTDTYISADATQGKNNGDELTKYLEGIRRDNGDAVPSIIQQKMGGVAISTARWWNGRAWTGPFVGSIEHKKAFNDELGPSTGCSFNAIWFYDDVPAAALALGFDKLEPMFLANNAPPCIYDMNAVLGDDGNAYFLEWTPRFGWDSEPTSFALLDGELGDFFWGLASGTADGPIGDPGSKKLAYSIRLGVPPYPWESWCPPHDAQKFKPLPIDLDLEDPKFFAYGVAELPDLGVVSASADGGLGIVLDTGRKLEPIDKDLREWIKEHKSGIPGLTARTDGAKCIAKDAKTINDGGHFAVPKGLEV